MQTELTIIMSEHNSKSSQLKMAIDSILNQTYQNFILLIVDDETKEENKKILLEYAKKDERIKVIKNEKNLGFVKSLNKAIKLVSTKYIARMDTDDIANYERLEKQIKFMKNHPEYAFIGTRANFWDEKGMYLTSNIYGEIDVNTLVRFCVFFHSSIMIRTDILKQVGMYDEYKRNEDYALYLKLYTNGFKGYILKEVLLDYRQDKESFKRKKYEDRIIEAKIRNQYFKLLKVPTFKRYQYTIKPLLVGLIPKFLLFHYKKIRNVR